MKRVSRRKVEAWLRPMRQALREMRSGEVDSIKGYAVTRLHNRDDYVRLDFCLAGFRCLINRLFPAVDTAPLLKLETRLANGVPMTVEDIDAALALLKSLEKPLMLMSAEAVSSAVMAEQVRNEMESLGLVA
ncbi:MAG: hypothetical protein WC023_01620 [Rhodocyclaceae bacterium]